MRLLRLGVVAAADSAVLLTLYPDWSQLAVDLRAPHRWLDLVGTDQAALTVVGAVLWCAALWLAAGLGFAAAAALPGRTGALAREVATRLLPAVLMRTVAGFAGVSVLVAPVVPVAASGKAPQGAALTSHAVPAPNWPVDPQHGRVRIGWPTEAPTAPTPHETPRPASPVAPDAEPTVRVRPGDSLWLIAARRLGHPASDAEIAHAWPRWYAANAEVIGADPSVIRPGQVLRAPEAG